MPNGHQAPKLNVDAWEVESNGKSPSQCASQLKPLAVLSSLKPLEVMCIWLMPARFGTGDWPWVAWPSEANKPADWLTANKAAYCLGNNAHT